MTDDRLLAAEEHIAHLTRTLEEISQVVAGQGVEIDRLVRRMAMLLQRDADRENDGGGGIALTDERPPHW
jgi:SlyX protein